MCYIIALSDECLPGQLIPAVAGRASEAEARRELTGFSPRIDWIFPSSTSKRYLKG